MNSTLTSLQLSYCYIGDEGALESAKAQKVNLFLSSLKLQGFSIDMTGVSAIIKAFRFHPSLIMVAVNDYEEICDSFANAAIDTQFFLINLLK